jgi:hypothetical protein
MGRKETKRTSKFVIALTPDTTQSLKSLAAEKGLTQSELVEFLLDFYELKKLDLLIANIRVLLNTGLTPLHKANLSVLYSYLSAVNDRLSF